MLCLREGEVMSAAMRIDLMMVINGDDQDIKPPEFNIVSHMKTYHQSWNEQVLQALPMGLRFVDHQLKVWLNHYPIQQFDAHFHHE